MKIINRACLGFIGAMGVPALVLWMPGGSDLLVGWAAPLGQPALVSDQAATRLDPTGFDQAQGRVR